MVEVPLRAIKTFTDADLKIEYLTGTISALNSTNKVSSVFVPQLSYPSSSGAFYDLSISHSSLNMSELSYCKVLLDNSNQRLVSSTNAEIDGQTVKISNCISSGDLSSTFTLSFDSCPLDAGAQDSYTVSCFNAQDEELIKSSKKDVVSQFTTSSLPTFDFTADYSLFLKNANTELIFSVSNAKFASSSTVYATVQVPISLTVRDDSEVYSLLSSDESHNVYKFAAAITGPTFSLTLLVTTPSSTT